MSRGILFCTKGQGKVSYHPGRAGCVTAWSEKREKLGSRFGGLVGTMLLPKSNQGQGF